MDQTRSAQAAGTKVRDAKERVGLVLPGGGARGAYQVGVLHAISDLLAEERNPFPVIVGASVGAINAAALACQAWNFRAGVERLAKLWSELHTSDIYRTDLGTITAYASRWLSSLTFGGLNELNPKSFLNNDDPNCSSSSTPARSRKRPVSPPPRRTPSSRSAVKNTVCRSPD